jgi:hypothetical protein
MAMSHRGGFTYPGSKNKTVPENSVFQFSIIKIFQII